MATRRKKSRARPEPRPRSDVRAWRAAEAVIGALAPLDDEAKTRVLAAVSILLDGGLEVAGRRVGVRR